MKRVILFIIDALTAPYLLKEMEDGRYPHFQQLKEHGIWRDQCVSIFPSITHAALSSLATGQYPMAHGVVGSHWYDTEKDKVAYFSGSGQMVLQKGVGDFFREFLLELNHTHLNALTIFQQLEREGYETASINFLIFRGDVEHEVHIPLLMRWIPGLPSNATIQGPKKLLLGDLLSNPNELDVEANYTNASSWFGFRDENTIDLVQQMAETDEFPDFTLAYFPENDKRSHADGPVEAHKHLANIDKMLGNMFEQYGSLDSFLKQFTLIITGDHSQSKTISDETEEQIDLEEVLSAYQLAEAGQPWQEDDEMMVCPNLRAAQIYLKQKTPQMIERVVAQLLMESRIDQVMIRADKTDESKEGFIVMTENGRLHFWQTKNGTPDQYGNQWQWQGDLTVVDGKVEDNIISFPDYPNAFERIAGVLPSSKSGQIWLTAKLGYEFVVPHVGQNPDGGSHASLHRLDSQPPLLVAGAPHNVDIPTYPRIIDVAPLCHACLSS